MALEGEPHQFDYLARSPGSPMVPAVQWHKLTHTGRARSRYIHHDPWLCTDSPVVPSVQAPGLDGPQQRGRQVGVLVQGPLLFLQEPFVAYWQRISLSRHLEVLACGVLIPYDWCACLGSAFVPAGAICCILAEEQFEHSVRYLVVL